MDVTIELLKEMLEINPREFAKWSNTVTVGQIKLIMKKFGVKIYSKAVKTLLKKDVIMDYLYSIFDELDGKTTTTEKSTTLNDDELDENVKMMESWLNKVAKTGKFTKPMGEWTKDKSVSYATKKVYRKLAKKFHSDINTNGDRLMIVLNEWKERVVDYHEHGCYNFRTVKAI